jgi:hypothetical protein
MKKNVNNKHTEEIFHVLDYCENKIIKKKVFAEIYFVFC